MTSSISPNSPSSITQGTAPRPAPAPKPAPPASATNTTTTTSSATAGEAVTLSAAAQASTQLLNAARDAAGVNPSAVEQIRTALQGGNYNVSPQDLAHAIATVLKEAN